ncbi:MAG: galactose mutarotase [Rhizobiales bacterium]|nr:galactose mutarotase [Hyphomicrobiales bacterium]
MTAARDFGIACDGSAVKEVELRSGELTMSVISWGAVIRDLRPRTGPMADRALVLGLNTLADYETYSPHFGAIAGRVANRIKAGRAKLEGREIALTQNTADGNHLHGGAMGFGRRNWRITRIGSSSVKLALTSPDGEEGYPGTLEVDLLYRLEGGNVITEIEAATDAPTFVNLAQHSYFNLDGGGNIWGHHLQIPAQHMTPTDRALVPTGDVVEVAGTAFDFRTMRTVQSADEPATRYDINYCLVETPRREPAFAARLEGASNGVRLDLKTTEPGLQFYDGGGIDVPVEGLDGSGYGPHSGLCLEAQRWPDAPNHDHFPAIVLRPGETYRQRTEFCFSWPSVPTN